MTDEVSVADFEQQTATNHETTFDIRRHFTQASTVTMRPPEWLDTPMGHGWIVKSGLTVMAGVQGLGKSTLAMSIAARVSKASPVVIFSAEDDRETTLVPRLVAAGAKLDNVFIHRDLEDFALGDAGDELLDRAIEETGAKLVVFDPVIAYTSLQSDSYRDQHVRVTLRKLQSLAHSQKFAVVGIMHFNKGDSRNALYRIGGSVAWTAAPRSVIGLFQLDEDDQLVLVHMKCNVGKIQPSRDISIRQACVETVSTSVVDVGDKNPITVNDLGARTARPSPKLQAAKAFLLTNVPLTDDRECGIASSDLKAAADASGHAWATVRNALSELPEIESYKRPGGHDWMYRKIELPKF
jgi:hypothetical protein